MKRCFMFIVFLFFLSACSCKSNKIKDVYGYEYGNPMVLSPEELQESIEKVNNGDLYECNYIAIHYESIKEPKLEQTVYWLTIGAERGEPTCMWNLGYSFYHNYSDKQLGLQWIKKAAELGQEDAVSFMKNSE